MMFETNHKKLIYRILKAIVKGAVLMVVYIISGQLLAPVSQFLPGLREMIQGFIIAYTALSIISTLVTDMILQHVLNTAKELFVVAMLVSSFRSGILTFNFDNANIVVDLRILLTVATMFGILGLAKSVLEAINYVNEQAEFTHPTVK